MSRVNPSMFLENRLSKWRFSVVDVLETSARFLLIRYKVSKTENEVVRKLATLFGVENRRDAISELLKKFGNHHRVLGVLNAWEKGDSEEILSADDVRLLFGQKPLEDFSDYFGIPTFHVSKALAECIPVIVKKQLRANFDEELSANNHS